MLLFSHLKDFLYSFVIIWCILFIYLILLSWLLLYHLEQRFSTFSYEGTHKLITKVLRHTKKYIFCRSDKKMDIILISFIPDGYCCVGCCQFFYLTVYRKRSQWFGLNSQVLHVLKIFVARLLETMDLKECLSQIRHSINFYWLWHRISLLPAHFNALRIGAVLEKPALLMFKREKHNSGISPKLALNYPGFGNPCSLTFSLEHWKFLLVSVVITSTFMEILFLFYLLIWEAERQITLICCST